MEDRIATKSINSVVKLGIPYGGDVSDETFNEGQVRSKQGIALEEATMSLIGKGKLLVSEHPNRWRGAPRIQREDGWIYKSRSSLSG